MESGSYTVRSLVEAETFHPVIGPVTEGRELYLRGLDLRRRLEAMGTGELVIWDIGLGAGANVLTVLGATRDLPARVHVVSFDRTLGALAFAREHSGPLEYLNGYESAVGELVERGEVQFADGVREVRWEVRVGDFPELLRGVGSAEWARPHAIFFDPFSPGKNPLMWSVPLFQRLRAALDPARPCALATYTRATMARAGLLAGGFFVGVGPGIGRKEETTLASNDLALLEQPLGAKWLERARVSGSAEPIWDDFYSQSPLTAETLQILERHPQFNRPAE